MAIQVVTTLNRFAEFASTLDATLERALDLGVATCLEVADDLVPVDKGYLKANKVIDAGSGSRTITWTQHYAAYQEMGTYKMKAQPYGRPGMDAALPVINAELAKWPGK